MSELAAAILEHLQSNTMYAFSNDLSQKSKENEAVDYLADNGYIVIRMRTIGYICADVI